jgi:hypothetical protein
VVVRPAAAEDAAVASRLDARLATTTIDWADAPVSAAGVPGWLDEQAMAAAVDGANDASIRFCERLGSAERARLPEVGAKLDRWLDLVLLELRLDDRAAPGDGWGGYCGSHPGRR